MAFFHRAFFFETPAFLSNIDDKDGPTYAAQYFADSKPDYNRYIEIYSTAMRQKT